MHPAVRQLITRPRLVRPDLDLDPSLQQTLWQDSAATTPVAASGDPVGRWFDLYGGTVWSQSTADSRPTWQANILNGYPVIRFDGTDDFLDYTAGLSLNHYTWMIVWKPAAEVTSASAAQGVLAIHTATGNPGYVFLGPVTGAVSSEVLTFMVNPSAIYGVYSTANVASAFGVYTFSQGASDVIRLNGAALAVAQYAGGSLDNASAIPAIFSRIGAIAGPTAYAAIDVARVLLWKNRRLRPDQKKLWERHLGRQYNIAVAG